MNVPTHAFIHRNISWVGTAYALILVLKFMQLNICKQILN